MPAHSIRSDEVERRILLALSEGTPLAVVCREEGMPTDQTWRNWCAEDENLAIAYARARDAGWDKIAQDCLEIADETGRDTKIGEDGKERPDTEWISRSKLRVETRLKLLAKWDPKRYGDSTHVKLSDPDGGPVKIDDTAAAARIAAIFEAAERRRNGERGEG